MTAPVSNAADFVATPVSGRQAVVEILVSEVITSWSAAGGGLTNTYKATVTQRTGLHNVKNVVAVVVADTALDAPDGIELFTRTTAADVNTTANSFFFDPDANLVYIRIGAGVNPSTYAVAIGFKLCFSTGDSRNPGKTISNDTTGQVYYPYLRVAPTTERSLCDPFIGSVPSGRSTVVLDASTGNLDDIFRDYIWHYAQVTVRVGADDMLLGDYIPVFYGTVSAKRWNRRELTLEVLDSTDTTLESLEGETLTSAMWTSDSITYTGDVDGYGYGYKGAYSHVGNFSQVATAQWGPGVLSTNARVMDEGTPLKIVFGRMISFSPQVITQQTTDANAHTAIVNLSNLGYLTIENVYVNNGPAGVSWWLSPDRGWLAVMLSLAAPSAASSIDAGTGITVTFSASDPNPAQVVKRICQALRDRASGVGSFIDLFDDTGILFSGGGGTLPAGIDFGASITKSLYDYVEGTGVYPPTFYPIAFTGRTRPIYSGSQTNAMPIIACGGMFGLGTANAYMDFILCLGETYVSVSAVRLWVGSSFTSTNVKYKVNAASGFLFVRAAYDPATQFRFQVDFVAPTLTVDAVVQPTGPQLLVNDDSIDAATTDYSTSGMSLGIVIEERAVIRDLLAQVVRDSVGQFYMDLDGRVCFNAYSPSTTGEFTIIDSYIMSEIQTREPSERIYHAVTVQYGYQETRYGASPYATTTRGIARSAGVLLKRTADYFCEASFQQESAGADAQARRLAIMLSLGAPVHRFMASKQCLLLNMGDKVYIDSPRVPNSSGVIHGYVSYAKLNLQTMQVDLEVVENLVSDMLGDW